MKKILLLVAVLALTISATAQEKLFTYGIKAGLTISQISSGTLTSSDIHDPWGNLGVTEMNATGYSYGFFVSTHANYNLSQFFGVQPELSFSMQGGVVGIIPTGKRTYHYNYINVPILLEIKPTTDISAFIGPQIGFNIHENNQFYSVNTVDFAVVLGAQYTIDGKYLISARYNISLPSVYKESEISGMSNRVFQLGIGYQF